MLDIKFLRENPDVVKQNIKNKFQDRKLPLVDEVIELDKENREIKQEVQALRADRNKLSKHAPSSISGISSWILRMHSSAHAVRKVTSAAGRPPSARALHRGRASSTLLKAITGMMPI